MSIYRKEPDGSEKEIAGVPYVTRQSIGLENVENKSSEQIRSEITKENVINALGFDPESSDGGIDVFMFMGQSNMCGQGNREQGYIYPVLIENAGYEYKHKSNTMSPISEPVGTTDNDACNGSLITEFANSYYKSTGRPIVAAMVAVSGSGIDEWQPNSAYLDRAVTTLNDCISYLNSLNQNIKHINMVWFQGEHEGARSSSGDYYKTSFRTMFDVMKSAGVENAYVIRIGEYNGEDSTVDFTTIINAQTEMCQDNSDIIMATTTATSMKSRGLMNDMYHFGQTALNEIGKYAGYNVAEHIKNGKEPTMYDPKNNNLYYSHVN